MTKKQTLKGARKLSEASKSKRSKATAVRAGATTSKVKRATKAKKPKPAEETISLEDLFPPTLKEKWQTEARTLQDENIISAREAYIHHGLVLYLGAGVSCSVGLPTWWEMVRSLTVTMMSQRVDEALTALKDLSEGQMALAKVRIQEEVKGGAGADKSILIMARSIKEAFGPRLPYEVAQALYGPMVKSSTTSISFLLRLFRPATQSTGSLEQYPAINNSKVFKAIVQLARAQRDVRGVQAIVNFNYDDLIEEWMREKGIRCDTLLSGEHASRDATLPCYHVHGVLPFARVRELKTDRESLRKIIGNFVFSEDEYHTEYSDPYRWSNMTMINQLGRYSGLFVGLSLQDPNLRRLIDVTHRQYPDIVNYAILTRKTPKGNDPDSKQSILEDLFEKVETESFENIGVKVIWTDTFAEVPARINDICDIDFRSNPPVAQADAAEV
jgi:hypothetical protein